MRGQNAVFNTDQRMIFIWRFFSQYIEGGSPKVPIFQNLFQGNFIDNPTSGSVEQVGPFFHLYQLIRSDQTVSIRC